MIKIPLPTPFSCHPIPPPYNILDTFSHCSFLFQGKSYPSSQPRSPPVVLVMCGSLPWSPCSLHLHSQCLPLCWFFSFSLQSCKLPLTWRPRCPRTICLIQTEMFCPVHFHFLKRGHAACAFSAFHHPGILKLLTQLFFNFP